MNDAKWEALCDEKINEGYECTWGTEVPSAYDHFDLPYHSYPEDYDDYPVCPLCGPEETTWTVEFEHTITKEKTYLTRCNNCGGLVP